MNDIERLAGLFKALSDPTRLKLVRLLARCTPSTCRGGPGKSSALCVGALAHELGVTQSAVSQHLRILRETGLVAREKRGNFVHYTIDPSSLERFGTALHETFGEESSAS